MLLSERAMLVSLSIGMIHGTKQDRQATADVEHARGGTNLGRFNKDLIDKEFLAPLKTTAGKARTFLYAQTSPWGDDDSRLLPSSRFQKFSTNIDLMASEYEQQVDTLIEQWSTVIAKAQARLGTLYNQQEYPSIGRLKSRFRFSVRYFPVPEAGDFRLTLSGEQVDHLKERLMEDNARALSESMGHTWARLLDAVSHMADQLQPDKRIHESLVGNLQELCEVLPELNFSDDPKLTQALTLVKQRLVVPTETLRGDDARRAQVAAEAKAIADKMKVFMGAMK